MSDSELREPMFHRQDRKSPNSKLPACFATVAFVAATALAVALAVTWVKELPCSSNSNHLSTPSSWIKFFHISDIHLDPDYVDTISYTKTFCRNATNYILADYLAPFGRIGCDSPELLVRNTFHAMKNASKVEQPDFIVVTGDMSAHRLGSPTGANVLNAITIATHELQRAFPNTHVFPCLGNNDVPDDYYIPPQPNATEWYEKLMGLWKASIMCSGCDWRFEHSPVTESEFDATFLNGGYYKAQISPTLTLLVLNTIYFSKKSSVRNAKFLLTAQQQMDWLRSELQRADIGGGKVVISGHIPPGIDPYKFSSFWFDNYTELYVRYTAATYPHVIGGQIFGHLHKDDFRFFYGNSAKPSVQQASAILLTASLTPVYRNNPTFRLVYMNDETNTFADYKQWYLDLAVADEYMVTNWLMEYTFSEAFPSSLGKVINPERILDINNGIISKTEDNTWLKYIWHRQVEFLPDQPTFSRNLLYCSMRCSNSTEFDQCRESLPFIPG